LTFKKKYQQRFYIMNEMLGSLYVRRCAAVVKPITKRVHQVWII
jgi:hypothetical protein